MLRTLIWFSSTNKTVVPETIGALCEAPQYDCGFCLMVLAANTLSCPELIRHSAPLVKTRRSLPGTKCLISLTCLEFKVALKASSSCPGLERLKLLWLPV